MIQLILILLKQKSSIYDIATNKSGRKKDKIGLDKKGLINLALHFIHSCSIEGVKVALSGHL